MVTRYFTGQSQPQKQVNTNTVSLAAVGVLFTITIGGVPVTFLSAGTSTSDVAVGLANACRSSTHPYFKSISWQSAGSVLTGTAYNEGWQFIQTSSAGAGGAITTATVAGTQKGPNYFDDADNWSGRTLPGAGDDIVIADTDIDICWGLDTFAATVFNSFLQDKSYIGRIGLDYMAYHTTANGRQTDKTVSEYRPAYLKLKITTGNRVDLGITDGMSNSVGCRRTMIDFNGSSPKVYLHGSNNTPADLGRPAVRLLSAAGALQLYILNAQGGIGVGDEQPGEASAIANLVMMPSVTNSWLVLGSAVTITDAEFRAGQSTIKNSGSMTESRVYGGNNRFTGSAAIANLKSYGGISYIENEHATAEIGNLYFQGGTIDGSRRATKLKVNYLIIEDMVSAGRIIAPDGMFGVVSGADWDGKISMKHRSA